MKEDLVISDIYKYFIIIDVSRAQLYSNTIYDSKLL